MLRVFGFQIIEKNINAIFEVEWESNALPYFYGRFPQSPPKTVLTPLDVHGSPLLFVQAKLY